MIRLLLDREWANNALRELVSLALINEDSEHVIYAERDLLPGMPSNFVRESVYPLFSRGQAATTDSVMTHALRSFLERLAKLERRAVVTRRLLPRLQN